MTCLIRQRPSRVVGGTLGLQDSSTSGLGLERPSVTWPKTPPTVGPSPAAGIEGWEGQSEVRHLQCPQASQNHGMLAPGGSCQPLRRLHLPHQMLSPPLKEELSMHSLGEDPSLKREGGAEAGMSSGSRRGPWNQEAETWAYRLV